MRYSSVWLLLCIDYFDLCTHLQPGWLRESVSDLPSNMPLTHHVSLIELFSVAFRQVKLVLRTQACQSKHKTIFVPRCSTFWLDGTFQVLGKYMLACTFDPLPDPSSA